MSSKFVCGNLIPNVVIFGYEAFGKWLDHEAGALMDAVSVLTNEIEPSLALLLCEDMVRR